MDAGSRTPPPGVTGLRGEQGNEEGPMRLTVRWSRFLAGADQITMQGHDFLHRQKTPRWFLSSPQVTAAISRFDTQMREQRGDEVGRLAGTMQLNLGSLTSREMVRTSQTAGAMTTRSLPPYLNELPSIRTPRRNLTAFSNASRKQLHKQKTAEALWEVNPESSQRIPPYMLNKFRRPRVRMERRGRHASQLNGFLDTRRD
eukprot:260909-Hanusia_phi.AAC.1